MAGGMSPVERSWRLVGDLEEDFLIRSMAAEELRHWCLGGGLEGDFLAGGSTAAAGSKSCLLPPFIYRRLPPNCVTYFIISSFLVHLSQLCYLFYNFAPGCERERIIIF